jgi:hypothetical protein
VTCRVSISIPTFVRPLVDLSQPSVYLLMNTFIQSDLHAMSMSPPDHLPGPGIAAGSSDVVPSSFFGTGQRSGISGFGFPLDQWESTPLHHQMSPVQWNFNSVHILVLNEAVASRLIRNMQPNPSFPMESHQRVIQP